MNKPNIQIDDLVREMTDEEYEELLASGWTLEGEVSPYLSWTEQQPQ